MCAFALIAAAAAAAALLLLLFSFFILSHFRYSLRIFCSFAFLLCCLLFVRFLLHFYFFDSPFVHFNCTNRIYVSFAQPHDHTRTRTPFVSFRFVSFIRATSMCIYSTYTEWERSGWVNEKSERKANSYFGCVMRYRHIKRLVSKHQIAIVYDWPTECDTVDVCVFASYSKDYPPILCISLTFSISIFVVCIFFGRFQCVFGTLFFGCQHIFIAGVVVARLVRWLAAGCWLLLFVSRFGFFFESLFECRICVCSDSLYSHSAPSAMYISPNILILYSSDESFDCQQ